MYVKIVQKWHEMLQIRTDIKKESKFQKYQNKTHIVSKEVI